MSAALNYPCEREPQTGDGSAVEVAPGVLWLRMPLFASLPWINVWAIAEEGGWSIVDTGLHSANVLANHEDGISPRTLDPSWLRSQASR
jgi:hypothetical protein